jgi:O-antigen ligase
LRTRAGVDLGRYPVTVALSALTCALTPAYTLRWRAGFYPSTVLEDAIVITVVAFLVEAWRTRSLSLSLFRSPLAIPALIFLVAGAIDVVAAPDRRAALGIYRAYLIEPVAFFFVLGAVVRTRRIALVVMAGLAAAGAVIAIANSLVIIDAIRHHTISPGVTGPVVIFTNANDIALFLVPLIAVAGAMTLHSSDRRERIVAGAFLAIAAAAVLLSFSRGGYLALAALALGLALSHRHRWWLVSAAALTAIVLLLIPPINQRVGVELDFANPQNTLVGRFELWRVSLQMLEQHFLFGGGMSGFAQAIAPYWNPTHIDRFIYPHNIVLTFWSETGLLGLFAFAWVMVASFVLAWRGWRAANAWRSIELGVFLALVAVLVHGIVDVPYFKNDLSLEFWALVGLMWAGRRWSESEGRAG